MGAPMNTGNPAVLAALTERGLVGLLDEVCRAHHVTRDEITGRSRSRSVAFARQDLWWRLREAYGFSYGELGRIFARNHTTVLHGLRRWESQMLAVPRAA